MNVYVAICYDRHIDDTIEVFKSIVDAKIFCANFLDNPYYARYGEWEPELVSDWEWFAYFSHSSDSPSARIERKVLK